MDRYWATLKVFDGGEVMEVRRLLGRYASQELAEGAARDLFWNKEVIKVAPESRWYLAGRQGVRIAIRSARILAAVVIAFFAYGWMTSGPDTGSIPIGQLTGDMIGGNILRAVVGLVALWACLGLAFGSGPKDSPFR